VKAQAKDILAKYRKLCDAIKEKVEQDPSKLDKALEIIKRAKKNADLIKDKRVKNQVKSMLDACKNFIEKRPQDIRNLVDRWWRALSGYVNTLESIEPFPLDKRNISTARTWAPIFNVAESLENDKRNILNVCREFLPIVRDPGRFKNVRQWRARGILDDLEETTKKMEKDLNALKQLMAMHASQPNFRNLPADHPTRIAFRQISDIRRKYESFLEQTKAPATNLKELITLTIKLLKL